MLLASVVVNENCARDDRRRRHAVTTLDHGLDAIGGKHLKSGSLRGPGQRVGVLADIKRPVDRLTTPVVEIAWVIARI